MCYQMGTIIRGLAPIVPALLVVSQGMNVVSHITNGYDHLIGVEGYKSIFQYHSGSTPPGFISIDRCNKSLPCLHAFKYHTGVKSESISIGYGSASFSCC